MNIAFDSDGKVMIIKKENIESKSSLMIYVNNQITDGQVINQSNDYNLKEKSEKTNNRQS